MRTPSRCLLIGTLLMAAVITILWLSFNSNSQKESQSNQKRKNSTGTASILSRNVKSVNQSSAVPKSGYLLQNLGVVRGGYGRLATYSAQANPVISTGITRTGNDSFFIDDSGVIRHSGNPEKGARQSDNPVE